MILTLKTLKRLGACEVETAKFEKLFGESVELTRELCVTHAQDFSFAWAAEHLLSAAGLAAYREQQAPLLLVCRKKLAPISAAYWEQLASLDAAYEKRAPLYAACREKLASLEAACREKLASLEAAYREQLAGLFFDFYARDHG